jgi:transcription elongation GreA/GreB family factor
VTTTTTSKKKLTKKSSKKAKPVRLRQLLAAIKTRRAKGGRMTQADYAVALDKVVRAISRSQQQGCTVVVTAVQVL